MSRKCILCLCLLILIGCHDNAPISDSSGGLFPTKWKKAEAVVAAHDLEPRSPSEDVGCQVIWACRRCDGRTVQWYSGANDHEFAAAMIRLGATCAPGDK